MKRVWKKPRRLHEVHDESTEAVNGMAGGTGDTFPGTGVAHHLMDQGWQVRWLGTADRMEADLVPKHGIEIDLFVFPAFGAKASRLCCWHRAYF